MSSKIKYRIFKITETEEYDSGLKKIVPCKAAEMQVVYSSNESDPYYNYGRLSSGSAQTLKTINPEVYNEWFIGAIVVSDMTVDPPEVS